MLAIVLNEKIISAASVLNLLISYELSLLLRAGAFPTQLNIIEEKTFGPSLGSDSIESGKKARIAGFVAVIVLVHLGSKTY